MDEEIRLYQSLPRHSEDGVSQQAYMDHLREQFGESIDDGKCWDIDKATAQIQPDDKDPYNGLKEVAIQWVPVEQEYQVVTWDGDKRDHRYCGDYYGATKRLTDQMVWDMYADTYLPSEWLYKQKQKSEQRIKDIEQMLETA